MFKYTNSNKGLTLIELLAVVVILAILAAIAVPSVAGLIAKSKQEVCKVNREVVERMYEVELTIKGANHSTTFFLNTYMNMMKTFVQKVERSLTLMTK